MELPIDDQAISYTISVIGGKWKSLIISALIKNEKLRFNELKQKIPQISDKMLSQQLKELESLKIINRKVYSQIPPKVEYTLTKKGQSLFPLLISMSQWGESNQ